MPASNDMPAFKPGEWVVLSFVESKWDAQILEDMGRLGVNGERIYSILVPQEGNLEPIVRDARESRLSPVAQPSNLRSAQYR